MLSFHFVTFDVHGQILKNVNDWSAPITRLQMRIGTERSPSPTFNGHTVFTEAKSTISQDGRLRQGVLKTDISILTRALHHSQTTELHQVLVNLELVAFAVSWFCQVCHLTPASYRKQRLSLVRRDMARFQNPRKRWVRRFRSEHISCVYK
jgi:hypothetical protein